MVNAAAGQEISDAEEVLDENDNPCTTFSVTCIATSVVEAEVQVLGIHGEEDWFRVEIGQTILFRMQVNALRHVKIRGNGGTTTVNYGIVATLNRP